LSETRNCNDGTLSGTFAQTSCSVAAPLNCALNGVSVAHGTSVTAYQAASVPFGNTCTAQTRTCANGTLSGTFTSSNCSVAAPLNCALNGVSVAHGSSVTAYQAASVPFGSTCAAETRACSNGTLSGTFTSSNCSVTAPLDCSFNGASIAHNSTVTAYQAASVPFGNTCTAQTRTCSNGTLSGTFSSSSCSVAAPLACSFTGASIAHNSTVTAYQAASVPFGGTCTAETRTCSNGTLSGTFTNSACTVGAPSACSFNGVSVAHGANVTAYLSAGVPFGGTCTAQTRTCSNGTLSGTFTNSACTVGAPSACSFNGVSVAHGANVTAYQNAGVPFGGTCTAETRTCSNGTLSGTFTNSACTVGAPSACSFNGVSIAHNATVTGYQAASVPFGGTCTAETRTCSNGTLLGTFAHASCSVAAPLACSFNGSTVAHGSTVTAYQAASVAYGGTCAAETRTCSNGTLLGTFAHANCSVGTLTALCQSIGAETLPGVGCKFHVPGNFQIASPSGARQVKVTVIGGGGGASSRDNNKWSGAHGAGGGAAIKTYSVTQGEIFNFTVGSGGQGQWLGSYGTHGADSQFVHPQGLIIGKGGGSATVWARVLQAFTTNYAGCGRGSCPGFMAPTAPTLGGGGIGGDVNCQGGNGGFCLNGEFNCPAQDAPLCDGKASGKSLPILGYGGGGGASEFGGNGVVPTSASGTGYATADAIAAEPIYQASCGGGGGGHNWFSAVNADPITGAPLPSLNGSHGCVIFEWIP
jgi:hypothetical protein